MGTPQFGSGKMAPSYKLPLTAGLTPAVGAGTAVFNRTSVQWYPDDAGVWRQAASGVPAITARGLLIEPARTNRCTNFNAVPADATTGVTVSAGAVATVEDAAALAAAGLADICPGGRLLSYTNETSSAATITIAGTAGGTNAAAISLWARAAGGTVMFQLTGGKGSRPIPSGLGLQRYASETITGVASGDQMQLEVPAGASVQWVLNQLELGADANSCGATTPIVVAGAAATRAVCYAYFPGSAVPSNDFLLTVDVTPTTMHQDNNSPAYLTAFLNWDNYRTIYNAGLCDLMQGGTWRGESPGKYAPQVLTTSRLGYCAHSTAGVAAYADGALPRAAAPAATQALDVAAGNVFLGCRDGSQVFTGWLRDVTVYAGRFTPEQCRRATDTRGWAITDLGAWGCPTYDHVTPGRIWALGRSATAYNQLGYSDDWGDSWRVTCEWTDPGSLGPYLVRDRDGNAYVGDSLGLYRIAGGTEAPELVLTWSPTAEGSWAFLNWAWGQQSDGRLWVAGYHLSANGYQRVWSSADGGLTWAPHDALISGFATARHVHSLRVHPITDAIYACVGDTTRALVVSNDNLDTYSTIPDAENPGPTCISINSEGVYTFSDTDGDTNRVDLVAEDNAASTAVFAIPTAFTLAPIYFGAMQGADALWLQTRNDADVDIRPASIQKWVKSPGRTGQWRLAAVYAHHDRTEDGIEYYGLAHDNTGVIPEDAPYVFVFARDEGMAVSSGRLLRIPAQVPADAALGLPVMQYFVDGDSGNNSNTGAVDSPFATVAGLVTKSNVGDTAVLTDVTLTVSGNTIALPDGTRAVRKAGGVELKNRTSSTRGTRGGAANAITLL